MSVVSSDPHRKSTDSLSFYFPEVPATIPSHAEYLYHGAGRGARRTVAPADRASRQTGGPLRRQIPNHRLHTEQLSEFRTSTGGSSNPVQIAFPRSPHSHRLGCLQCRTRRIHRIDSPTTEDQRRMVPRHLRRGVPEFVSARYRPARVRTDSRRRSHL